MRAQQAGAHELGQDRLGEPIGATVGQRAGADEGGDQRRRHYREAQPQRRRQRLAEGAAIDHVPGAIEAGERRQWLALPAELRVAVVLQNPGIGAARPVQQRETAADRQGAAQRGGVRRRDEGEPSVRCGFDAGGDVEPFLVAADRHGDCPGGEQRATAGDVARILDPGGVAGIEQQVGSGAQRLLGAGGDDDAAGIDHQPACRRQMRGNLLAEHQQALWRRIAGQFAGQRLQDARGAAGPGCGGKQVRRR